MDQNSNNQYYHNYSNTNNMTPQQLYQNYINFINNSTQILNNTVTLLSNQQNTYNNIINQYNLNTANTAYHSPFTNRQYRYTRPYTYRGSSLTRNIPLTTSNTIFIPSIIRNTYPQVPTINDLINNVSYCLYNDISNNVNDTCPITQREFIPTDIVLKINSCNHIFDPQALLTWLSQHNACPMCRHNITEQTTNNETNNNDNNNDNDNNDDDNDDNNDDNNDNNNNVNYDYNSYLNNSTSFAVQLANIISNEISREADFSGNIQIELGISGRE